ncbi:MAG: hypothetical protein AB7L09_01875 [Nitrospira sp.]
MARNDSADFDYKRQQVTKSDRKLRKAMRKMARRAEMDGEEMAPSRERKQLRRLARQNRGAMRDAEDAAVWSLRD